MSNQLLGEKGKEGGTYKNDEDQSDEDKRRGRDTLKDKEAPWVDDFGTGERSGNEDD